MLGNKTDRFYLASGGILYPCSAQQITVCNRGVMRLLSSLLACASLFVPSCAFLVPSSFRFGAQRQSCEAQQAEPANHRASRTTSCRTSRQRRAGAGAAAAASQSEATGNEYERIGVIICDHGSRREQANSMLLEVAERYRSFAGCDVVEVCLRPICGRSIFTLLSMCTSSVQQLCG